MFQIILCHGARNPIIFNCFPQGPCSKLVKEVIDYDQFCFRHFVDIEVVDLSDASPACRMGLLATRFKVSANGC